MNLGANDTRRFELTATDLKQWAYCPRIPYYHHVMPVEFVRTYKMERGKDIEAAVQAMEKRRGFRRYGLDLENAALACGCIPSHSGYRASSTCSSLLRTGAIQSTSKTPRAVFAITIASSWRRTHYSLRKNWAAGANRVCLPRTISAACCGDNRRKGKGGSDTRDGGDAQSDRAGNHTRTDAGAGTLRCVRIP